MAQRLQMASKIRINRTIHVLACCLWHQAIIKTNTDCCQLQHYDKNKTCSVNLKQVKKFISRKLIRKNLSAKCHFVQASKDYKSVSKHRITFYTYVLELTASHA